MNMKSAQAAALGLNCVSINKLGTKILIRSVFERFLG